MVDENANYLKTTFAPFGNIDRILRQNLYAGVAPQQTSQKNEKEKKRTKSKSINYSGEKK